MSHTHFVNLISLQRVWNFVFPIDFNELPSDFMRVVD